MLGTENDSGGEWGFPLDGVAREVLLFPLFFLPLLPSTLLENGAALENTQ